MRVFTGYQKGVDLGGWFSQCDHSEERYDTFITEKDFAVIKGWGCDHVRLPVDYDLLEDKNGAPREKGYERLERAISWARENGLNLVLDLHKTAGFSFDPGEREAGFFENEKYQERFCALWERIARRFGKYADQVAFELLNARYMKPSCLTLICSELPLEEICAINEAVGSRIRERGRGYILQTGNENLRLSQ